MTIPRLAANLGDAEMDMGGTFTVLSRLPRISGLALEHPINFDRLYKINQSKSVLERKQYETTKWPPLETNAIQHLHDIVADVLMRRGQSGAAFSHVLPPHMEINALANLAAERLSLNEFTVGVETE